MQSSCPLHSALAPSPPFPLPTVAVDALPASREIQHLCNILEQYEHAASRLVSALNADRQFQHAKKDEQDWHSVKKRILSAAMELGERKRKHDDAMGEHVQRGGKVQSISRRRTSTDEYGTMNGSAGEDVVVDEAASTTTASNVAAAHATATTKASTVTIQQFWNAMDAYLRPITENDLHLLDPPVAEPMHIPPLGLHYARVWAIEDGLDMEKEDELDPGDDTTTVLGNARDLREEHIANEPDKARPLPFTARLLTLLVPDVLPDVRLIEAWDTHVKGQVPMLAYTTIEERLKKELRDAGLPIPDEMDWAKREDDEVCARLRELQTKLQQVVEENARWKAIILDRAKRHMAVQEYEAALEEREKQFITAYSKRYKGGHAGKSKKKGVASGVDSSGVKMAMIQRQLIVSKLGPLTQGRQFQWPPTDSMYPTHN